MRFYYICKRLLIPIIVVVVVFMVLFHHKGASRGLGQMMDSETSARIISFEGGHSDSVRDAPSTDQRTYNMITSSVELTATDKPTTHHPTHHFSPSTTGSPYTWPDQFCNDFFSNRFTERIVPCEGHTHRVVCHGSPYDDKMGSCMLDNVAMDTDIFYKTMFDNKDGVRQSKSLWFNDPSNFCSNPQFDFMDKKMMGGDYVKRITQTAILTYPQGKCSKYINGTTFMFMGFDDHIYFKFLSWFSLLNGIINYEQDTGIKPSLIIRIPELKGTFTHEAYEQRLFTDTKLISLKNFTTDNMDSSIVCFNRLVITPWAYSTNAFRCKMSDSARRLRKRCFNCNGKGLNSTRFMTFRRQVLSACSIQETKSAKKPPITSIVVQVRKPYIRRPNDDTKKFSRVLENADELINGLHNEYPGVTVTKMLAEEMSLCDQIRLVYNTDVLMGVHGAGLVHLWWLQDHALLFELVPPRQRSNPSFKMLSTLTGRRYYGYERLKGQEKKIKVDVPDIVKELKKQY